MQPNQKSEIGFYFHIPFCPHICPYCDFVKTSQFQKKDVDAYFENLEKQLDFFLGKLRASEGWIPWSSHGMTTDKCGMTTDSRGMTNSKPYATVYFGGGTPGLFPAKFYLPLINKIKSFYQLEEVTLETNPHTNWEKFVKDYRQAGFDRITLGAQSLCPQTLKTLGRKHSPKDILTNIEWAKQSGFENIQVDLIYGLKKELRTIPVEKEIEMLAQAGATGISAYFLTLEKRTLFAKSNLVDEDHGVEEYLKILSQCKNLGFEQIETSNFSKFATKHNQLYWTGRPYIGMGTGAHGLLPPTKEAPYGTRYKIGKSAKSLAPGDDLLIYRDPIACHDNFEVIYDAPRTKEEMLEELFFTLLRTKEGVPISWLQETTNRPDIVQTLLKNAKFARALEQGQIFCTPTHLGLAAEEKIRGDAWALEFLSLF